MVGLILGLRKKEKKGVEKKKAPQVKSKVFSSRQTGGAQMSQVIGGFADSQGDFYFGALEEGEIQLGDAKGFSTFSVLSDLRGKKSFNLFESVGTLETAARKLGARV